MLRAIQMKWKSYCFAYTYIWPIGLCKYFLVWRENSTIILLINYSFIKVFFSNSFL
jgi:hypothetical protein